MSVRTIYLRLAGDQIERSDDQELWRRTGIRLDAWSKTMKDLADYDYHDTLRRKLTLEHMRRVGYELWKGLFEGASTDYGSRIHLVPVLEGSPERDDKFVDRVCQLPWQFLTRGDSEFFLSRDTVWPVVVSCDAAPGRGDAKQFKHVRFPTYPELVLIVPDSNFEGENLPDTEAKAHRDALRKALEAYYVEPHQRSRLHFVKTFDELRTLLSNESVSPELIYFHGHGSVDDELTQLLFNGPSGKADWQSIDELRLLLASVVGRTNFKPVAWVNACNAGFANFNSVPRALSGVCCSVVSARTVAYVTDSRLIAEASIPAIAIRGHEPAAALRDALKARPLPADLGRFANTMVTVQYKWWTALAPTDRGTEDADSLGDFAIRIDRSEPLGNACRLVESEAKLRLGAGAVPDRSKPVALAWRGGYADSLEVFEQRLSDAIHERFYEYSITVCRVDLNPANGPKPDDKKNYPNAFFSDCLIRSLHEGGVSPSGALENQLAILFGNRFHDGPALVVFEHGTLTRTMHARIAHYLAYWEGLARALGLGDQKRIVVVLGFSIDESSFAEGASLELPLDLRLGTVSSREVFEHFNTFGRQYGISDVGLIETETAELMASTGGAFRPIHEDLEKRLRVKIWSRENDHLLGGKR